MEQRKSDASAAVLLLADAVRTIRERGIEYDRTGEERSMATVVAMFNLLHDYHMTEEQGWSFMELLKMVRFFGSPSVHTDSVIDQIAYTALRGECVLRGINPTNGNDKKSDPS